MGAIPSSFLLRRRCPSRGIDNKTLDKVDSQTISYHYKRNSLRISSSIGSRLGTVSSAVRNGRYLAALDSYLDSPPGFDSFFFSCIQESDQAVIVNLYTLTKHQYLN